MRQNRKGVYWGYSAGLHPPYVREFQRRFAFGTHLHGLAEKAANAVTNPYI